MGLLLQRPSALLLYLGHSGDPFIKYFSQALVRHAFNLSTGGRGRSISELEASLVYRVSSKTARATQRNPAWKKERKEERGREEK